MTFISYAQNLEDVMLWRALKHVENGFYVDVGANDPKVFSITNAFYQRGWHGINIDPSTYDLLCRERSRDINLDVFAGSAEGHIVFYDVSNSALSTSDPELAEQYRRTGYIVLEKKVRSMTLNQILGTHSDAPIHFMSIDVEGAEMEVLQGLDLSIWRPWIILVESTIPETPTPAFEKWENLLLSNHYDFEYFDGLNRFYIAREHKELRASFSVPPNIFDQYILSEINDLRREISNLKDDIFLEKAKIRGIQRPSFQSALFFWLLDGPLGKLIPFRKWFEELEIRSRFFPRLGVLSQYRPLPVRIPFRYYREAYLPDEKLPVISLVTPSCNQAEFIERTIRSVFSQKYPKLEYVIQDGNSEDGSKEIIEKYRHQLTHAESVNDNGQAAAINLGFGHTSGEIMAYLNSDDMLVPGTLRYVAKYFADHPEVDVVYGHRIIVDELDREVGVWVLPPHDKKMLE